MREETKRIIALITFSFLIFIYLTIMLMNSDVSFTDAIMCPIVYVIVGVITITGIMRIKKGYRDIRELNEDIDIPITTLSFIKGHKIRKNLGLCYGSAVITRHLTDDMKIGIITTLGGESRDYAELINMAIHTAMVRMAKNAKKMGANAVVNVRIDTTHIMNTSAEIYTYGDAVVVDVIRNRVYKE